jgi:hypothetical protein
MRAPTAVVAAPASCESCRMSGDSKGADNNDKEPFSHKALGWVITGLLAVAAAYLGACQAGKQSRATVEEEFDQQATASAEANERRARAVARTMIADLDGAVLNLCQIGTRGSWYVTYVPLRSRISDEDRLLLAQQMSDDVDAWQDVQNADTRLVTWDAVQRGAVGAPVDPIDWGFKGIIRKMTDARRALETTAGYDPGVQAEFRQACKAQDDWKPPPKFTCDVPSAMKPEDVVRLRICDKQRRRFYKRHPELLEGDPLP